MPEIRQNVATGEWVIIATERARRPEQFVQPYKERVESRPVYDEQCPFCPGNEEHDLEVLRLPESGDWQLRIVRNKYPALNALSPLDEQRDGLQRALTGFGHHEVLVEGRLHNTCAALQPASELELMLRAFQLRGRTLREDPRIHQLVFFKNHGRTAGASLVHPHTQMIALPIVPYDIAVRIEQTRQYYEQHGSCVICDMYAAEEREQVRVVATSQHFVAFIPYAAYSPFHIWLVPRRHCASFLNTTAEELRDLSVLLRDTLRKIYVGLNDPDYNYVIRTTPEHMQGDAYLHWYMAIIPRVTRAAGFELSTGMYINTSLPEESVQFLREVEIQA